MRRSPQPVRQAAWQPLQQGFTLVELMISVAILATFSSMALGLGVQARRDHQMVTAYQQDLRECRQVLRNIERDLRGAQRVDEVDGGIEVHGPSGSVRYEVRDGELSRADETRRRTFARCIERIEVSQRGALITVSLHLQARAPSAPRRAPVLATSVAMRNMEAAK